MNDYSVFVSYDGEVDTRSALFTGSYEDCKAFMRRGAWNKWNVGKMSLDIRSNATGRLVSFIL